MSGIFFFVALLLYAVASVLFAMHLLIRKKAAGNIGAMVFLAASLCHAIAEVYRFLHSDSPLKINSFEGASLLALSIGVIFIALATRYRLLALGAFVSVIVLASLAASLAFGSSQDFVASALRSTWFPIHLATAIFADALFVLAGVIAFCYLMQDHFLKNKNFGETHRKLPSLNTLDHIGITLLVVGFLFLSVGMLAGSFMAFRFWGKFWYLDPRQVWSFVSWSVFAFILTARMRNGFRGKKAAWLTLLTVVFALSGMIGVSYMDWSKHKHTYASPESVPGKGSL